MAIGHRRPEKTCAATSRRGIIVGIGHDYRRDDAVGLVVARRIAALNTDDVIVHCLGEDILGLLEILAPDACVVIVDAVVGATAPGTLHCLDLLDGARIPARPAASSHHVDLGEVLALAHKLGRTPAALKLVGVSVAELGVGRGLSPAVDAAVDAAIAAALSTAVAT